MLVWHGTAQWQIGFGDLNHRIMFGFWIHTHSLKRCEHVHLNRPHTQTPPFWLWRTRLSSATPCNHHDAQRFKAAPPFKNTSNTHTMTGYCLNILPDQPHACPHGRGAGTAMYCACISNTKKHHGASQVVFLHTKSNTCLMRQHVIIYKQNNGRNKSRSTLKTSNISQP